MDPTTLEELSAVWRQATPPSYGGQYDAFIQLQLPTIGPVLGWVRYDYGSARYELYFVRRHQSGVQAIELHTEPEMVRFIRICVRRRIGIKFMPTLRVIGTPQHALPASVVPQLIDR